MDLNSKITPAPSEPTGILTQWWPFAILSCAWLLAGLFGHDPWKADEPYSFGMVHHILTTGDWIVPTIAGEPFLEKPPLFYISSALLAKLFLPFLPLHDGARLACAVFMIITFIFTALIARELWGKSTGKVAVIILMGCVGLLNHAHKLITDISLLTGFAMALYGLALSRRRVLAGGFWTGTGVGIGFMSKGLLAPGLLGVIALALPFWCRPWRSRGYFASLAVALGSSLPWFVVWPLALYRKAPHLFREWFWVQNFGRFFGFAHLGTPHAHLGISNEPGFYLFHLPYFAWPAIPLALWSAWQQWHSGERHPFRTFPVVVFTIMFITLSLASDARCLYALPMLLPLSLMAVPAVASPTTSKVKTIDQLGIFLFAVAALGLWIGWIIILNGQPVSIAREFHHESPAYLPMFEPVPFAAAIIYTLLWGGSVMYRDSSVGGALFRWAAGMTLVWGLLMTLWLPWTNAMRSYRTMVQDMKKHLPTAHCSICGKNLGESERAMFEYFGGIQTQHDEVVEQTQPQLLLVGGCRSITSTGIGPSWQKLWEGSRPGNDKELFTLYQNKALAKKNHVTCGNLFRIAAHSGHD